jgi:glycine C-acetyltransferase
MRQITPPSDDTVVVLNRETGKKNSMLMFGSNNYLGLANHPYVVERVKESISKFGVGTGGPPILNGYTDLHFELGFFREFSGSWPERRDFCTLWG